MNDFCGPNCSCLRDLSRQTFVPSPSHHLEISSNFNEGILSGSIHHSRDRAPAHGSREEQLECPRGEVFDSYRFFRPVSCESSSSLPHYSSVPYDYLLQQSDPYNLLHPPPGLCKSSPHTWTHEEAFPYGMSSAEDRGAVASISAEGTDEGCKQTCSRYQYAAELTPCDQLDMGHSSLRPLTLLMPCHEPTGEKHHLQATRFQITLPNNCSPNEIIYPMVLKHRESSTNSPLYTAEHTLSPEQCFTEGRGDNLPVSQVQGGYSSQLYLPPLTTSSVPHPSSISTAPGYPFNMVPGPYASQTDTTDPDAEEMGHSAAESVRTWERSKKPCNCTKSQCLKMYCDCFASGEFCSNCNCINCCNNQGHEPERYKAIKTCLERNPKAFLPKIDSRKQGDVKSRHTKGCNCKRSGCLKNYCECYEAKIMCSSTCKCVGCRNYDGSPLKEEDAQENSDNTHDIYSTKLMWVIFSDRTGYEPQPFLTAGFNRTGGPAVPDGNKKSGGNRADQNPPSALSQQQPSLVGAKMTTRTRVFWTCSVVIVILVAESHCVQKQTTLSKNWGPQSMLYLKGRYGRRYAPDSDDNIYNSGLKSWYTVIKDFQKLKTTGRPVHFFTTEKLLIQKLLVSTSFCK
ncbi:spexin prohormone 2 isoform X2 [Hoplias malabaricus]|uniref:spexin prohormone 2 isoform X2 n=1 Tax=Hoplias malabaricus TaxID=27720 RepID=UPI00346294CC